MPVDEPLYLSRVGGDELEAQTGVALAQLLDEIERRLRQPSRVHGEDAYVRVEPVGHVEQRHVALLEGGGEREPLAESLQRPGEEILRLLALELDRQLAGLEVVQQLGRAHASLADPNLQSQIRDRDHP